MSENQGANSAPGPGANYGIQNYNSTVSGPQAAGPNAIAQGWPGQNTTGPSADAAELARAVEALRRELARLRSEQPQAVSEQDAERADAALREVTELAAQPEPDHRALRDRVGAITAALGGASALTTALSVLGAAVRKLIGVF